MPPAKKMASSVENHELSNELGKLINQDVKLLAQVGWPKFVQLKQARGDFTSLTNIDHPAKRLLLHYKHRGAPVKFSTPPWSRKQVNIAIKRGPHKSCTNYIDFLHEEFVDMIRKGQWVVLPASVARTLPGIRISPPGVVPQQERRTRWICDYT